MSYEAWKEGHVASSEKQLAVVAPPPQWKREAVSSRLRQTLVHPEKSGILAGLQYSADGRRLFAGHLNSGIVQVWDSSSGQQVTRIETGQPTIISMGNFLAAPEGKSVFVNNGTMRTRSTSDKEKRLIHFDFSGGIRQWDALSSKPLRDFPPAPGRGVASMKLSLDGSTLLMLERPSGDFKSMPRMLAALWDAKTGKRLNVALDKVGNFAGFSADGKHLAAIADSDKKEEKLLLLLDAASGAIRRSLSLGRGNTVEGGFVTLSPKGTFVACLLSQKGMEGYRVKCWNSETGREMVSFSLGKVMPAAFSIFSPDEGTLVVTSWNQEQKWFLHVIDVEKGTLRKCVDFANNSLRYQWVFSPDGQWIAAISQTLPRYFSWNKLKVEDAPQPHILLIESATGEVRETLVAPPGIAVSLCFSPDGKTLASGGDGRVLLWDMTKAPGSK